MDAPDGPPEIGRLSGAAAFLTAVAGIIAVCAGLQVGTFLIFRNAWARPLPWVVVLAGAACVWVAIELMQPRRWAPAFAVALVAVLALGGFAWSGWLTVNGFRTPLVLLLLPVAALAAILLSVALRDLLTVARARHAVALEIARIVGESSAAPSENSRRGPVVYGGVGLVSCVISKRFILL